MDAFAIAVFLAVVNERLIEYFATPLKAKYPNVDFWWLLYVALVTGGVIGWLSGVNLFDAYIPDLTTGRILTAVVIGGGSSLIHDLFGSN